MFCLCVALVAAVEEEFLLTTKDKRGERGMGDSVSVVEPRLLCSVGLSAHSAQLSSSSSESLVVLKDSHEKGKINKKNNNNKINPKSLTRRGLFKCHTAMVWTSSGVNPNRLGPISVPTS